MVVVKTIWGYDMQHIIELCFDGILFHLMWTPPQWYVNRYELGFFYPQYTTEGRGQSSWTDWMQQNYIPYINYNNHTAEEPWSVSCHCRTTSTFHVRKLSIITYSVFIYTCNSNFSKKWNICIYIYIYIYEQNKNYMFLFSCYSLVHRNTFSLFVQKDLENGLCWACCDLIITYHRLDILFPWIITVAALIPHLPGTVSFIKLTSCDTYNYSIHWQI